MEMGNHSEPCASCTLGKHFPCSMVDYTQRQSYKLQWENSFTFVGVRFMARQQNGVNKSEQIRQMLRANPKVSAKEVKDSLEAKGIPISDKLFYLVKGKMLGKRSRKRKARKMVAQVAGLRKLKALVDALTE